MIYPCIYAIEHPDGYFKVGTSEKPLKRVGAIQVGSPYDLELRLLLEYRPESLNSYTSELEDSIHSYLEPHHVRGEWYGVEYVDLFHLLVNVHHEDDWATEEFYHIGRERANKLRAENDALSFYRGPL